MAIERNLTLHRAANHQLSSDDGRKLRELWLLLAQRRWGSLAVLPAHGDGSVDEFVRSLAAVGELLAYQPVAAVSVGAPSIGSAPTLASVARHLRHRADRPWREPQGGGDSDIRIDLDPHLLQRDRWIIGLPSVLREPAVLAVTNEADAVLLAVELGRTRIKEIRQSIELVGRERIAGCFLV